VNRRPCSCACFPGFPRIPSTSHGYGCHTPGNSECSAAYNGQLLADYTTHYNTVRLHSAIGYVTPKDKLDGQDQEIFAERDRKLAAARERRQQMRQAQREAPPTPPVVVPRPAIDFTAVRAAVHMAAVLQLLGFRANSPHGIQQRGPCPIHNSTSGTSRCFSVNLDQQIFHCFKCGRHGNALDLWAQATRQTVYDAAIDLCNRLNIPLPTLAPTRNREEEPVAPSPSRNTIPTPDT